MKNFKNKQGFSSLILIVTLVVVLGGGYYVYKSQFLNTSPSSGVIKDLEDLKSGGPISKNSPTNWGTTLCDYFTLTDAQAVLGSTAYLPTDGFTANVCNYHVPNGGDSFNEPKASLVILYRSYSSDFAKIMHDSSIKSGAQDLPGVGEIATINTDKRGGVTISFFNKGVLGGFSVSGFSPAEKNVEYVTALAKRVIPKLPQ